MVVCIIVNWNGADDTLACLASLDGQTATGLHVIVVDNGSADDSAARIANYIAQRQPTPTAPTMQLLQTGANLGFAAGNNAGIQAAQPHNPDFYWLLNNDTVAPPDTLALLLAEAAKDSAVGIVGTVLYYAHAPQTVQAWGGGRINPSIAFSSHFTAPHTFVPGDYLTFASVLIRRAVVDTVGPLSPAFFMYMEDAEMCLRAQKAGFKLVVAADTHVLHAEGGSRKGKRPSLSMERTVTRSGLELIRRHGSLPILGPAIFIAGRVANRLRRGQFAAAWAALAGAFTAS